MTSTLAFTWSLTIGTTARTATRESDVGAFFVLDASADHVCT